MTQSMNGYRKDLLHIAITRGWDPYKHEHALLEGDETRIALTHPYNLVTEAELASPEQLDLWDDRP